MSCFPAVPAASILRPRRTIQFGPLDVAYDERVLVPRPWTLAQSHWVAELAAGAAPGPILELCCGAGHIGLAAAVESDRPIVQVDADPVAAAYARANAHRAGWSRRTDVRCARVDDALGAHERFPLMLADPPYLRCSEIARFPEDPATAVDGGDDGLVLTRACLAIAARHLLPGTSGVLQVAGPRQAEEVHDLVARSHPRELTLGGRVVVDDDRALVLLVKQTTPGRTDAPTGREQPLPADDGG